MSRKIRAPSLADGEKPENPFIAPAREDGDNRLLTRHIRNSVSLTQAPSHRIICGSN
jgi:hypothetical protein